MSRDDRIEQLLERQAIIDLSLRYSRGVDRLDRELLESVYWPDGTDDHGIFKGTAPEYVDWVLKLLSGWTSTQHSNSNFMIEIEGDRAFGECEWVGFYRYAVDGKPFDQLSAGRYLDRYERRGGEWRISHRTCTTEWSRGEAVERDWRAEPNSAAILGRRDRSDLVYALRDIGLR